MNRAARARRFMVLQQIMVSHFGRVPRSIIPSDAERSEGESKGLLFSASFG
jgi:hypothetical protein